MHTKCAASVLFVLIVVAPMPMALAQQASSAPVPACPEVDLQSPDLATVGDSIEITATVTGGDENVTPTYNWVVSDGTIESGQGTSTITVNTSEVASGFITATVEIGAYERDCQTTQSSTMSVAAKAEEDEPVEAPEKPPH